MTTTVEEEKKSEKEEEVNEKPEIGCGSKQQFDNDQYNNQNMCARARVFHSSPLLLFLFIQFLVPFRYIIRLLYGRYTTLHATIIYNYKRWLAVCVCVHSVISVCYSDFGLLAGFSSAGFSLSLLHSRP